MTAPSGISLTKVWVPLSCGCSQLFMLKWAPQLHEPIWCRKHRKLAFAEMVKDFEIEELPEGKFKGKCLRKTCKFKVSGDSYYHLASNYDFHLNSKHDRPIGFVNDRV